MSKSKYLKYSGFSYVEAQKICQKVGIKNNKEYQQRYKELGLPSNPHKTYRGEWKSWYDFLGTEKVLIFPYLKAQKICKKIGIKNQRAYFRRRKEFKGLPSNPNVVYAKKWVSWYDFLGVGTRVIFPSYIKAQKICKEAGITTIIIYKQKHKELGLPSNPDKTYREEWKSSYSEFLGGTPSSFPSSYIKAQKICKEAGITTLVIYKQRRKELGLPSNPKNIYKKEWISWSDFLGTGTRIYLSYTKARKICREVGIKDKREYLRRRKEFKGLPSEPKNIYKKEWISWIDFLGKGLSLELRKITKIRKRLREIGFKKCQIYRIV